MYFQLAFWLCSVSTLEALVTGTYSITAYYLPEEFYRFVGANDYLMKDQIQVLWNTPGVSEILMGTKRSTIAKLNQFSQSSLNEYTVDEEKKKLLINRYFDLIGCSSERFVDVIASLWS